MHINGNTPLMRPIIGQHVEDIKEQFVKSLLLILSSILVLLITGCAVVKFDTGDRQIAKITPAQALNEARDNGAVIWGGRIVAVRNLQNSTEIEVLSYPLSNGHQPKIKHAPGIRFLAIYPGYLEPINYASGRYISLFGELRGETELMAGNYELLAPVMQVEQLHLWEANPDRWQNHVNFGVGIGITL